MACTWGWPGEGLLTTGPSDWLLREEGAWVVQPVQPPALGLGSGHDLLRGRKLRLAGEAGLEHTAPCCLPLCPVLAFVSKLSLPSHGLGPAPTNMLPTGS